MNYVRLPFQRFSNYWCSFSANESMPCYFISKIITLIYPQNTHINSKVYAFVLQKRISIPTCVRWCSFKWYKHLSKLSAHLPSHKGPWCFRLILNHIYNLVIVAISLVSLSSWCFIALEYINHTFWSGRNYFPTVI